MQLGVSRGFPASKNLLYLCCCPCPWFLFHLKISLFLLPVYMVGNGSLSLANCKRMVLLSGPALNLQGGDLDWVWCSPLEPSTVIRIIGHCRNVASGSPTVVPINPQGHCLLSQQGLLLHPRELAWLAFQPSLFSDPYCHEGGGGGGARKRGHLRQKVSYGERQPPQ